MQPVTWHLPAARMVTSMNMCVWLLLVWCVAAVASCVCIVYSVVQVQAWLCSAVAVNRCICIFSFLGLGVCMCVGIAAGMALQLDCELFVHALL